MGERFPKTNSFERLKRDDDLYKYTIVIEYNTRPIVAGDGSAIFVHVWRSAESPTAGCVALSERNVKRLLKWLDVSKQPVIVLENDEK
jgi:L,D-peptidoglycan transpeptidase YkuD (ErfK/YbiS/YcfS/YnhG family)